MVAERRRKLIQGLLMQRRSATKVGHQATDTAQKTSKNLAGVLAVQGTLAMGMRRAPRDPRGLSTRLNRVEIRVLRNRPVTPAAFESALVASSSQESPAATASRDARGGCGAGSEPTNSG